MPTVGAARPGPPAIRVRRVPPLDPPFDDDVAPDAWAAAFGAAQLPLDLVGAAARLNRSPVPGHPGPRSPADPSASPPTTGVAGASTEARAAVRRFLGLCLEILNGYRPVGHLRALADPAALTGVLEQVTAAVGRVAELRGQQAGPTIRSRREADPVRVRRLRVCEPRAGAAEATVVLATAGRVWALALRLERRDGRWAATAARLV